MQCVQPKSIQIQQENAGTQSRCPFSSPVQHRATVRPNNVPTATDSASVCLSPRVWGWLQRAVVGL